MKNLEALVMTRALVKEEKRRGRWDQDVWADGLVQDDESKYLKVDCGTTACVAGWAVIADKGKFLTNEFVKARDYEMAWSHLIRETPVVSVEDRARRLLGLDWDEAEDLFDGENSYKRVKKLLKRYIKEARKETKEGVR